MSVTDDTFPSPSRPAGKGGRVDAADLTRDAYEAWSDERLKEGYRRNSVLLREYGVDERTIQALCAIEACLRARDVDPDEIVAALEDDRS